MIKIIIIIIIIPIIIIIKIIIIIIKLICMQWMDITDHLETYTIVLLKRMTWIHHWLHMCIFHYQQQKIRKGLSFVHCACSMWVSFSEAAGHLSASEWLCWDY